MSHNFTLRRRDVLASSVAAAVTIGIGTRPVRAQSGRLPAHILDGQVHIWQPGGKQPSKNGRQEPFSAEQLLQEMDAAGVERAVIVPPSWGLGGNEYPLQSAEKYPDRLRVMGLLNFPKPDAKPAIESWMDRKAMVGARMFLAFPKGAEWLASGAADWLWPILADKNIPLAIHAGLSLPVIAQAAEKYPNLKICLDGFGLPTGLYGANAAEKFGPVAAMAKYPNIIVKTGAIGFMAKDDPYPYKSLQSLVRKTYDAFGPDRMVYASDITLLKGAYKESVTFWTELDWMSDKDREAVMGGTFSEWLNWPLPA